MIRLASEADIPQIIALTDAVADLHGEARPDILKAHPRHISEEKLLKNLRSEAHLVIVSELDGVIARAMLCTLRRLEGDIKFQDALVLSIEDTSVEKRYRKSGIGSVLLQFAISEGARRGCAGGVVTVGRAPRGRDAASAPIRGFSRDEKREAVSPPPDPGTG